MGKRTCIFNADLQKKYPYFTTTSSQSDLRCEICNGLINIGCKGKTEIERHLTTTKHKKALNAASTSHTVSNFFTFKTDYHVAACEGVWAYHVIKANHSFRSSDCASKIFRTCFDIRKFHCARTKCEAIAVNVFAPFSTDEVAADLEKANYVCTSFDASNHGSEKLMPVVVRYFQPTVGVKVKMMEVSSEKGETALIISNLVKKTAEEWKIDKKLVAVCGDNCPTNFGSRQRGGQNNVYYLLKQLWPMLLGLGCAAHIVHNGLKSGCDGMPFDIECVLVKIYSHFYLYTVRVEALKTLCDLIDVEYTKIKGCPKTRFLAMGPALTAVLKVYEPLSEYFRNFRRCPKILKEFFEDPCSKMWLLFLKSQVRQCINSYHISFLIK